jgi:hypothetical protein
LKIQNIFLVFVNKQHFLLKKFRFEKFIAIISRFSNPVPTVSAAPSKKFAAKLSAVGQKIFQYP